MFAFKRKSFRSAATVAIALTAVLGSSAHAEAALLGPSSNYIVQITPEARATVENAIKKAGGRIDGQFKYAFDGFVVNLPDMLIPLLKRIPNILTVEKDMPISGLAIQQNQTPTPSWGLDRIDQREVVSTTSGYQGNYGYRSAGNGSTIYIGDTGIFPHEDLAGRISTSGFSGVSDGNGTVDCNGHGTHVTTTAAGTKYGIAKNATVVPVRVLFCNGMGMFSTVIAGLDWILSPLNPNPKSQAVLNLSIGGNASTSINDAVLRLTNAGITVVAAAGNESKDACTRSPASAPSAITVGATTSVDARAAFSNFGSCVDIFAPGAGITGGWIGSPSATVTISGTSMAAPHVAGAAAVYLGLNPKATVAQVADALKADSTKGAVTNIDGTTLNNMLFVSPTDGGPAVSNPAVLISTITGITHLQAEASVEINPNNAPTTASFEYATDSQFTQIVKRINLTPDALVGGESTKLPVIMDGLQPTKTYYFRATAANESGTFTTPVGEFKTIAAPVTAPTPVVKDATNITGWSARLNGTVNANNGATNVSFVFGTDPEFRENTQTIMPTANTVYGNTPNTIGLDISFLKSFTKYYYKVVAGNSAASVTSDVATFTTAAITGALATAEIIRPTTGLNTPSTTVTGRINPNGQTTSIRLVYGSDSALVSGNKIVNLETKYTGIDTVTVSADMTGLVPGTRYYYRYEATNAAGIAKSIVLTNVGNPVMPAVINTNGSQQTQTSVMLNATVNAGAGNTRMYFIYGSDPKLESGTVTAAATPFAITNGQNTVINLPLTGLKPDQFVYFRVKILAYTGPLMDQGGVLLGPIASIQTLAPTKTAQSISFTLPTSRFYGGAPTILTATATSGLPVTYKASPTTVCQIVDVDGKPALTHVLPIPAGTGFACQVTANQPGDATYAAATGQGKTINFIKEATRITAAWSGPITVAGSTLSIKVASTAQPLLNEFQGGETAVVISTTTPRVCAISQTQFAGTVDLHTSTTVKALWNGSCQLSISFPGYGYWQAATQSISVVVSGVTTPQPGASAPQSINFLSPSSREVGVLNALSVTASSGLPVTLTSTTPAVCSIVTQPNGSYAAKSETGATGSTMTCSISASQSGDDRWAAASSVTRSFSWTRKSQAITFNLPLSRYYGGAATPLVATSTSALPVTFTTSTPAVCKIEMIETSTVLSYVTPLPSAASAICSVQASQAGNNEFAPAAAIVRSVVWSKENTTLRANWAGAITINGTDLKVSVLSVPLILAGESNAGTSPLTFRSNTPKVCTVEAPTYVGDATAHSKATVKAIYNGSCQIQIAFAGNSYWLPSTSIVSTTISGMTTPQPGASAAQTINFTQPVNSPSDKSVALTATATSALAVSFASLTPAICIVAQDNTGKYSVSAAAGITGDLNTCQLQATQAGDDRWAAAAPVTRTLRFVRVAQSITFNPVTSRFFGGPLTQLIATSTSGLPVTFKSTSPAVCEVTAGETASVVSYVTPFTTSSLAYCSIEASQGGDNVFAPASTVTRTITLRKESTVIKPTWSGAVTVEGATLDLLVGSSVQPTLNEQVTDTVAMTLVSRTPSVCKVDNVEFVGSTTAHTRAVVKALWNGTCVLSATFAGSKYWLGTSLSINATVSKLVSPQPGANVPQSITMTTTSAIGFAQTAIVAPRATSGLAVALTTTTPDVCTVTASGSSYNVKGAAGAKGNGNICTLQATQAGNDGWAAAPTLTRNITINKANMTVRLSRWSSALSGKTPNLFVAGVAYIDGPSNGGLNSLGDLLTFTNSTPSVCSVTGVGPYATTAGTYTQATITGITNGTCTVTMKFAATDTQNETILARNITISGIK
jgi:subtilisin family serine protease/phosphodiesterase/alkaline phosphatase D-like protein